MADWKFGDVIRRHEDGGPEEEQAHAMVVHPHMYSGYVVIGLGNQGSQGYKQGEMEHKVLEQYWTLVKRA